MIFFITRREAPLWWTVKGVSVTHIVVEKTGREYGSVQRSMLGRRERVEWAWGLRQGPRGEEGRRKRSPWGHMDNEGSPGAAGIA